MSGGVGVVSREVVLGDSQRAQEAVAVTLWTAQMVSHPHGSGAECRLHLACAHLGPWTMPGLSRMDQ